MSAAFGYPQKHILTDIPAPAAGVSALAVFPDHADGKIAIGDLRVPSPSPRLACRSLHPAPSRPPSLHWIQVKVLLGFRNHGESMLNVSHIAGSLNVVGQFSQYVQNLTLLASLPSRPRPNRASRRPSPPPDPWPPRCRARGHRRGARKQPLTRCPLPPPSADLRHRGLPQ